MMRRLTVPTLILAAAALLAAGRYQDEHLLRFELKPDSSEKFKVEMTMDMDMDAPGAPPSMNMKSTMDFELLTGKIGEDGKADIEMKTTNMQVEGDMLGGNAPEVPKEMVVKAKLDDRYRITDVKAHGPPDQAQMIMGMSNANQTSMFIEFPEKPVKIGESWTFAMAKNPMLGEKEHLLTATLKGLATVQGTPAYEIDLSGKIDLNVDMAEAMKKAGAGAGDGGGVGEMMAGMEIIVKGSIDVAGTVFIAQKGGRLLSSQTQMASKQSMEMMGMNLNIAGKTNMKMSRVP